MWIDAESWDALQPLVPFARLPPMLGHDGADFRHEDPASYPWPDSARQEIPAMSTQRTILVVDDEYRDHLVDHYTAQGCKVVEAVDGQDAIDKLQAGLRPDVILTDLTMPRVDGNGLVEWIAEQPQLAAVRVAFITGRPQSVSAKARQRAQAVFSKGGYNTKDIDDFVLGKDLT